VGFCADAGGVLFRDTQVRQRELLSGHPGHHHRLDPARRDRIPAAPQEGHVVKNRGGEIPPLF